MSVLKLLNVLHLRFSSVHCSSPLSRRQTQNWDFTAVGHDHFVPHLTSFMIILSCHIGTM